MSLISFPMAHLFRDSMPLEQIATLLMENGILLGRLGEVLVLFLKQYARVRLWATSSQMGFGVVCFFFFYLLTY